MNQDVSITPGVQIYQGYVTMPVNIGVDVVNNDVIMGKNNQNLNQCYSADSSAKALDEISKATDFN